MSSITQEDLSFCGNDDEDVTIFFRSLLRLALAAGHQRDNEWLLDHLEISLAGPALEYFISLEHDTRTDFQSARNALVQRFGGKRNAPPAAVPAAPPPAAAPPPPAPRTPLRSSQTLQGPWQMLQPQAQTLTPSPTVPGKGPSLLAAVGENRM